MSALLEFECQVPVSGYEVITVEFEDVEDVEDVEDLKAVGDKKTVGDKEKSRMLQPRSQRTRRFDLFEFSPSAFLEFAQTPATEDGIKAFADRYGPLYPDRDQSDLPENYEIHEIPPVFLFPGRYIYEWRFPIKVMHRHVELWNMSMRTGDFSKIIRGTSGDPVRGSPVDLFLKEDPLSASAKLCIRPPSLAAALRAQLLLAIDGNVNLSACVQCRKWFTLEAGRGRSDKEYCSNACRMRAYRKRKVSG